MALNSDTGEASTSVLALLGQRNRGTGDMCAPFISVQVVPYHLNVDLEAALPPSAGILKRGFGEVCNKYAQQGSNLQPSVPKTDALSN